MRISGQDFEERAPPPTEDPIEEVLGSNLPIHTYMLMIRVLIISNNMSSHNIKTNPGFSVVDRSRSAHWGAARGIVFVHGT